jgi:hypothetical protein
MIKLRLLGIVLTLVLVVVGYIYYYSAAHSDIAQIRNKYSELNDIYLSRSWDRLSDVYDSSYYISGGDGKHYSLRTNLEQIKSANADLRVQNQISVLHIAVDRENATVEVKTFTRSPSADRFASNTMVEGTTFLRDHWRRVNTQGWRMRWSEGFDSGLWMRPTHRK